MEIAPLFLVVTDTRLSGTPVRRDVVNFRLWVRLAVGGNSHLHPWRGGNIGWLPGGCYHGAMALTTVRRKFLAVYLLAQPLALTKAHNNSLIGSDIHQTVRSLRRSATDGERNRRTATRRRVKCRSVRRTRFSNN